MTPQQLQRVGRRSAAALVIVLVLLNLARIGFIYYFRGWEKGPPLQLPTSETLVRVAVRRGNAGPWSELSPESGRELVRVLSKNWKVTPTRPVCILGPIPPHFEVRVEETGGRWTLLGLGERCESITSASRCLANDRPTISVLPNGRDSCYWVDESASPRALAIVSATFPPADGIK